MAGHGAQCQRGQHIRFGLFGLLLKGTGRRLCLRVALTATGRHSATGATGIRDIFGVYGRPERPRDDTLLRAPTGIRDIFGVYGSR